MERLKLANLVAFAKLLAQDKDLYKPGMEITYTLQASEHEMLQLELYMHMNKTDAGFKSSKKFEFEVMDVTFVFKKN